MGISVNPPPQLRIPETFRKDKVIRKFFEQQNRILFQLWNRTGGSNDAIEDSQQNITSSSSRVSRNAARINSLELKEFEIIKTTVGLTSKPNQIIICKNPLEENIILDPNAVEDDELHVKRRGATINLIGDIDGKTNLKLNIKLFSWHGVFDGEDWSQI